MIDYVSYQEIDCGTQGVYGAGDPRLMPWICGDKRDLLRQMAY